MNIRKEIIHANLVRWNCEKSFSLCSYLNNDDRISAYAWFENGNGFQWTDLKTGVENDIFSV